MKNTLYLHGLIMAALAAVFAPFIPAEAAGLSPNVSFAAPRFMAPSPARGILLLPDDKFLRFRNTASLVEQPTGPITRHFADGSLDTSFQCPAEPYFWVSAALRMSDGKFIIAAARTAYDAEVIEELLRLNSDGSIDSSFQPVFVAHGVDSATGMVLLPDEKILVSGFFTEFGGQARPGIVRLLANGTLDSGFAPVPLVFSASQFSSAGWLGDNEPVLQTDGKIIIFGNFRRIGSASYPAGVARLHSDGTVDSTFQPSGFTRVGVVRTAAVQSDGKVLIGGRFSVPAGFAANPTGATYSNLPFVRLEPNGSADQTYGYFNPAAAVFNIRDSVLQLDGKVVAPSSNSPAGTLYRFHLNGTLDTSFRQPLFQFRSPSSLALAPVPTRIARDSLGRIVASGSFDDVDSATPQFARFGVARFHNDGTLDTTLATATRTGLRRWPAQAWMNPSGQTLISFGQHDYGAGGETPVANNFARLNANGAIDGAFQPFTNPGPNAPLESDFVAGGFVPLSGGDVFIYGTKRPAGAFRYGRLLSDGTQDLSFASDPAVTSLFTPPANVSVTRIVRALQQPTHGILLSARDGQAALDGAVLRRLTPGGTLDSAFQLPTSITESLVVRFSTGTLASISADSRAVAVQPDGKILFVYLESEDLVSRLVRLNADGSLDGSFNAVELQPSTLFQDFPVVFDPQTQTTLQPPNGVFRAEPVADCEVQSDGQLVITGPFQAINGSPARGIARLSAGGIVDTSFQVGSGPGWSTLTETENSRPVIEQVESDIDGKLLVTGTFESFNGVPAPGIARLNSNGSVDTSLAVPAVRHRSFASGSALARQADSSFLLSGPYTYPNDPDHRPVLLHLLPPPALTSAASSKQHGTAGEFAIPLPLTGRGVECRSGGASGVHRLIFNFNNPLVSGNASVTSGTGSVAGNPVVNGKTLTVELTGVANLQTVTVTLQNVTDTGSQVLPDTPIVIGFLIGDSNGDGTVNAGDALQTRSRSGQDTSANNFRSDFNLDAIVNVGDALIVKGRSGNTVNAATLR